MASETKTRADTGEIEPIVRRIEVGRSAADTFDTFVQAIDAWWPLDTHSRAKSANGERAIGVVIEPFEGGRVFERLADGRELDWGDVVAFEPGNRLAIDWRMGRPVATSVEVAFEPLGPARCRVTLTHSGWERLEAEGAATRDGYAGGWSTVFEACFAAAAAADGSARPLVLGAPQSNFVWTIRIALAEKGVAYDLAPLAPHTPEIDAVHPLGKIPVLRHGALAVAETLAIADHLDAALPGPRLVPATGPARARTLQWASIAVSALDPALIRGHVFAYLFSGTPNGRPDPAAVAATLPALATALDALERGIAAEGDWFTGAEFTLVDAYLAPMLHYAARTPEGGAGVAARPRLAAYAARLAARDSVRATLPPPLPRA